MQSRSDKFVKDLIMFTDNWKESRGLPTKYLKQEEPSKEFRDFQFDRIYVFFFWKEQHVYQNIWYFLIGFPYLSY